MKSVVSDEDVNRTWLRLVQQQVGSLRFGLVQIVVHDGRVVQIERTEKVRLEMPAARDAEFEI